MNNTSVDSYLQDGCGRCDHFQTPNCKVLRWTPALVQLRELALAAGLTETMKWGSPCYTVGGKNAVMIVSFKESCALQFFKGSALDDPLGLLESAGPNAQHGRLLRFRHNDEVAPKRAPIQQFLQQALALEQAGVTLARKPLDTPLPLELAQRLDADAGLARAFAALTPGRQRSHILHVSGAKQSGTRARRAEACIPKILAGRGFLES